MSGRESGILPGNPPGSQPVRHGLLSRGLSGSQLKLAAVITMLIDHTAFLLLGRGWLPALAEQLRLLAATGSGIRQPAYATLLASYQNWVLVYRAMRTMGRVAFPIYAFLLVEGYCHTRDWRRYGVRLGIFALVSEVPFDLVTTGSMFSPMVQNVFFTLLIGLLTLKALDFLGNPSASPGQSSRSAFPGQPSQPVSPGPSSQPTFQAYQSGMTGSLLRAAVLVGALYLAWYLHTDYDCGGILLILVFYYFRAWRQRGCFIGLFWMMCVSGTWYYLPGYMASFGLIWLYNGQRGWQPWPWKMAYYLFYPLHLLALYGIYVVLIV